MTADLVDIGPGDVAVSFLPLSHITARHVDYLLFQRGVTVAYCPNFDDLPQALLEVRPTIFVAVPRVYEKIHNKVLQTTQGTKLKIFNWALSVGHKHREQILNDITPKSVGWKVANRLVSSKRSEKAWAGGPVCFSREAPHWDESWLRGTPILVSGSMKVMA